MLLLELIINYFIFQCEGSLRIYGGRDALRDEFPYVVRLETHTSRMSRGKTKTRVDPRCTGAALTSSWILSAAHCADENDYKTDTKKLVARCSSYFPKYKGYIRPIFEVKSHLTFETNYIDDMGNPDIEGVFMNDICLFRSEGIVVSRYARLSPVDYISLTGHEAYTLGYGATNASQWQKPLQVLKGMIQNCLKGDLKKGYMLCLAPQCGVQTTICGGDSGGPVVHPSGIVGVNSDSTGDCDEYSKSLIVSVGTAASEFAVASPNIDWISNIIANKSLN